jgi:hypothetical protein
MFNANVASATIMDALYGVNGQLDTVDTNNTGITVAYLVQAAGAYPSGVPGIDTTYPNQGDQALGGENSNTYCEIKLVI